MTDSWFNTFQDITFLFASIMLFKYFVFLMIAPFYGIKEKMRKIRNRKENFNPLVSIVIPAWNEEVGVVKSIRSLLTNTYKNIENKIYIVGQPAFFGRFEFF